MRRALSSIALALVSCCYVLAQGASAQHPVDISQMRPGERTWAFANGAVASVKFEVVATNQVSFRHAIKMVCRNECHGGHTDHSQCDGSCDTPCTTPHFLYEEADFHPDMNGISGYAAIEAGYAGEQNYIVNQLADWAQDIADDFLDDGRFDLHMPVSHWNKTHCSFAQRFYGDQVLEFRVHYAISKPGSPTTSGDAVFGQIYVPLADPLVDLPPVEDCKCHLSFAVSHWDINSHYRFGYNEGIHGDGGSYLNDPELSALHFSLNCLDINNVQITAQNTTGHTVNLFVNPGTVFNPESDSFQRMVLLTPIHLQLLEGASQSFVFSRGPTVQEEPGRGRLNCLDMDKKAPDGSMGYTVGSQNDDTVRNLAWIAEGENIRGPWDQTRFWIYESQASFNHVRERLIPSPTAGGYLNCAWESAVDGGMDFSKAENEALLEPRMLLGGASYEAMRWMVKHLSRNRAGELADWVNSNASGFSDAILNAKDEDTAHHVADTALALSTSHSPLVRLAAMNLLLNGVPDSGRKDVMSTKSFARCAARIEDPDESVALKALEVVGTYKYMKALSGVQELSAKAAPAIKTKASTVLAQLQG